MKIQDLKTRPNFTSQNLTVDFSRAEGSFLCFACFARDHLLSLVGTNRNIK